MSKRNKNKGQKGKKTETFDLREAEAEGMAKKDGDVDAIERSVTFRWERTTAEIRHNPAFSRFKLSPDAVQEIFAVREGDLNTNGEQIVRKYNRNKAILYGVELADMQSAEIDLAMRVDGVPCRQFTETGAAVAHTLFRDKMGSVRSDKVVLLDNSDLLDVDYLNMYKGVTDETVEDDVMKHKKEDCSYVPINSPLVELMQEYQEDLQISLADTVVVDEMYKIDQPVYDRLLDEFVGDIRKSLNFVDMDNFSIEFLPREGSWEEYFEKHGSNVPKTISVAGRLTLKTIIP
jgi:hypothetical protein